MRVPTITNCISRLSHRDCLFLIPLVFVCFGLSLAARAVLPSPNEGYPNGNAAEGDFALESLTTGTFKTALGTGALFSNTTGLQDTTAGAGALRSNVIAVPNTAVGTSALITTTGSNTTVRLKSNFLGNDGGNLTIGLVSSLKISTNTDYVGNHVREPGVGLPVNYSLPAGFTLFGQTRIDILDEPHSGNRRVQWSNPIGVSRAIVGNLSGYLEFCDAVSPGDDRPWIETLDIGLIYQVTPNFSIDINSFFGLTRSDDEYNVFVGFGGRL